MVGSASISGLASGLDTASIISQLMQLESLPQTRLKNRVSTEQTAVTSLQNINTKVAALTTKAEELAKVAAWSPITATSSYDKVTVTTTSGAAAGSFSFTVGQLAKAHELTFTTSASLSTVVTSPGTLVRLDTLDGNTVDIDTGDGTLQGLVSAVNAAGAGVRATTVKLDDGTYRLRVTATATGAASDFTLKNVDGTDILGGATVTAGQDAAITLGPDTIHSSTNTFTDLLPGVSVTLGTGAVAGTAVDVDLAADSTTMSDSVKALVDALNSALTDIDVASRTATTGVKAGPLAGDFGIRSVRDHLVDTLYSGDGTSLSTVGIQLDRDGKFTFDEAKFKAAYEADPTGTAARFVTGTPNTGFAARVAAAGKAASDPYDGTLSGSVKSRQSTIDQLNDSIANWDIRLQLRQETLNRQFTALETALSQMNSQSSWLAGQIAQLPSGGGG